MPRHSERIKIARTGLELSRLGLGTAPLGGMFASVSEDESDGLVEAALDLGIHYFDTAPLYGHGRAEIRLGRVLAATGKPFALSTKVGRILKASDNADVGWFADADPQVAAIYDYSAQGIERSIQESLERLGLEKIDIAYIHDADDLVSEAISTVYPVLDKMRSAGKVNAIGIGMNKCAPSIAIIKEVEIDIALIAGRFSLLDQEAQNELFPLALKKGVSIAIGGVFNSGLLANPNPGATYDYLPADGEMIARARKIGEFLREFDLPLTAAALQFPLRHPAVTTVLTGARSAAELRSNVADFDRELPEEIWGALEAAGLIEPLRLP